MVELVQKEKLVWEIPKKEDMLVPGRIYADKYIIDHLVEEEKKSDWNALKQIKNVACLPGIQLASIASADVHVGYGAPIGGIAGIDFQEGVICFGIIGFDCNCGVRTLLTPLTEKDLDKGKKEELAEILFKIIPAGLGVTGELKLSQNQIDEVLAEGAKYVVRQGYGTEKDLEFIEENGCIQNAKPENVSLKAKQRQFKQVGTLGSGNHYLEIQVVEEIFDEEAGKAFGLFEGQLLVSIHCGSRALGHQIGSDYLSELDAATKKYGIKIKDRELVCAPIQSKEGQKYWGAVNAGINCAFANRQVLGHLTRQGFKKVFGLDEKEIELLYDVGHNTCKKEVHEVNGEKKELLVHRKGATRGFGPGRKEIPEKYRETGQPVLVGGTMGTSSYILKGTEKAMNETFGSTIHGAGRAMSRVKALKQFRGQQIVQDLARKGIILKSKSMKGIAEEAPNAYKDVVDVVQVMHDAGISLKVAKLRPVISIKG